MTQVKVTGKQQWAARQRSRGQRGRGAHSCFLFGANTMVLSAKQGILHPLDSMVGYGQVLP